MLNMHRLGHAISCCLMLLLSLPLGAEAAAKRPSGEVKSLSTKEGLALAQKSNCLACHSIDKKIIGPAWADVARKYKGAKGAEDRLVVKVSTGGYGNWGSMPMPAMAPDVKEKDIRALVRFVLHLAQ
jgi:cytochrome c